jgi:D-alanine-D-alanine ligase
MQLNRKLAPYQNRLTADVPPLSQRPEVLHELSACDAVFPLIHGVHGEDGTLQGMLEMFGLPYAGCGVPASALGMDKSLQKGVLGHAGISVAEHYELRAHEWNGDEAALSGAIEQTVGYPAFVKPANGGSSVGVSKVRSREDLGEAMRSAFAVDAKVLVEETIEGRELECGVIGYETPQASPVGEVAPAGDFYDYRAKYLEDSARLIAPAAIDGEVEEAVRATAVRAFEAIDGGSGFARVDFFLQPTGRLVLNEINTIPGFTPISMFPRLWQTAGLTYRELISRLVDLALTRFSAKEARHG